MSFYAKNFIYDGQSSELYGLICASTQGGGQTSSSAGSNISIIEEYVLRRETPYFYGVSFSEKLQFDIEFYSETYIPRQKVSEIERWLFGSGYKEFEIIQEDLDGIHYNCLFMNPSVVSSGNQVIGFTCTCVCDAPWAWGEEMTHTKTNVVGNFTINNTSDNPRYTKPILTLTFDSAYDVFYVENISIVSDSYPFDNAEYDYGLITAAATTTYDYGLITNVTTDTYDYGTLIGFTDNAMVFEDIENEEVITIDTDLRLITSNKESIVSRFNGKYMYLLSGNNIINISDTLNKIEITYTPARKVGS